MKVINKAHILSIKKKKFKVCDTGKTKKRFSTDTTYTIYNTEVGKDNQVPLWLIGFLY